MTSSHIGGDPRQRHTALHEVLRSFGAAVRKDDVDRLPDGVIEALCDHEARRIRALVEGTSAGWTPGWRHALGPDDRDENGDRSAAVLEAVTDLPTEPDQPANAPIPEVTTSVPIQVRPHRPPWRASA